MTLNKRTGKMFRSVGWTWNPLAGCTHGCPYCYARSLRKRFGKGFDPEFRKRFLCDELPDDGTWIFVGSMGDTFCDGFDAYQIRELFKVIKNYEGSCKFLLQTKNIPRAYDSFLYDLILIKDKVIMGTTLETNRKTLGRAPPAVERADALYKFKQHGFKTFVSCEPLCDFDEELATWIEAINPEAVEIGLENYSHFTNRPPESKILKLMEYLESVQIEYLLKENLEHLGDVDE